jgi:uncharacterized zinc-type alcohol dehydrogenase-like protein
MCAGATAYTPLRLHAGQGGLKLGVVGVGGLGHLALQYGRALGYEVTAISTSPGKCEEAMGFGAHAFIHSGDQEAMRRAAYSLDLLLITVHGLPDWEPLLDLLKKRGVALLAGFADLGFNPTDLVAHEIALTGSFLASRAGMEEMLAFSAAQGIHPLVEQMPMSQINLAVARLKANEVRYRIVLANQP